MLHGLSRALHEEVKFNTEVLAGAIRLPTCQPELANLTAPNIG